MALSGCARFGMARMGAGILLVWLALGLVQAVQAGESGGSLYRFAPTASWVKPATAEYGASLPSEGVSNGSWRLLFDRQINVTTAGDDFYVHSATRVISSSGVDERSQIDVVVDPTYQRLDIHSLRVMRQDRTIDLRRGSRITALPQETELRNRIYNGSYNINILLPDVRTGDVVEYEYTIHSRPRNFPGHFEERLTIAWGSPLHYQRLRILSPLARELFYRVNDGRSIPVPRVHDALREFEWEWHNLAGVVSEEDRPQWYETWPYLQVSDTRDWSTVARRMAPLFSVEEAPSSDLEEVVRDIRAEGGAPAQLALHALQFVQEQIRYVSISIGHGAYQPASPNTVLSRRFGDCKDKSLLLVTILRELGIEARPALVNSRRGRLLDAALPTPYIFDHVIVRAKIGQDTYWLDGTADKQFSPLSTDSPADFERALVADANTNALESIPRPGPDVSGKKSEVVIDMRSGVNKPAKLQITTSYMGRLADSTRRSLADDSPEQRLSDYVNYIASYYPGARISAPITINDDTSRNLIQVRENYDLGKTFTKNEEGQLEFFLQADELYRYSRTLKSSVRKVPLAITYPIRVQQTVRAILPAKWPVQDETVKIENPAFRYQSTVSYSEQGGSPQLTADYRYVALSDTVAVADLAKYEEDRKRVYDDLGYYIRPIAKSSSRQVQLAPLPRIVLLLSLALGTWIALRWLHRFDPEPASTPDDAPVGIRGWMLLPAFVVIVSPFATGLELYEWARYLDVDRWYTLHDSAAGPFKPWAQIAMLVIAACGTLLMVGHGLLAWVFFTRRTSAPGIFVSMCWAAAALNIVVSAFLTASHLGFQMPPIRSAGQVIGGLVRAGIYTAYMVLSKRAKATFVMRLRNGGRKLDVAASTT
jgi:transglutaminase-like putative cysteine protease